MPSAQTRYAQENPAAELCVHAVQKNDAARRLCRLNLALHGLEGEIKHGGNFNSYYDDPPFNVNALDAAMRVSARRQSEGTPQDLPERQDRERLKDMVGLGRRFPFGLPRTDNANHHWIQLFFSTLNEKGRAGFVMAKSVRTSHSCSMRITEDIRKQDAEQGISAEEMLKKGMEAKSKEFVEQGAEVYAKV